MWGFGLPVRRIEAISRDVRVMTVGKSSSHVMIYHEATDQDRRRKRRNHERARH